MFENIIIYDCSVSQNIFQIFQVDGNLTNIKMDKTISLSDCLISTFKTNLFFSDFRIFDSFPFFINLKNSSLSLNNFWLIILNQKGKMERLGIHSKNNNNSVKIIRSIFYNLFGKNEGPVSKKNIKFIILFI